jgi:hypothetical protein
VTMVVNFSPPTCALSSPPTASPFVCPAPILHPKTAAPNDSLGPQTTLCAHSSFKPLYLPHFGWKPSTLPIMCSICVPHEPFSTTPLTSSSLATHPRMTTCAPSVAYASPTSPPPPPINSCHEPHAASSSAIPGNKRAIAASISRRAKFTSRGT